MRIMGKFIGRELELKKLIEVASKKTSSFIVVRGRRRIGKSRLIEEFGKHFDAFYTFAGLPPEKGVSAQHQLEEFSRQIAQQFKAPRAYYDDWGDALWAVGQQVKTGKILLLFDEISWMESKDPTFLGKIKNFWDQYLKKNDKLVFVVCGSASAWIEKNILSSTGFVGRISYTLTLEELPLIDCARFWPKNISAYEQLKVLAITGGVPRYLEEIDPNMAAEENIKRLCFTKGGFLVEEFKQIFSDLFLRESVFYKKIIEELASGAKDRQTLCDALAIEASGRISEYLNELELAGFITRDYAWNLRSGDDAKLSMYRLSDNYLRFYIKYIDKALSKINRNAYRLQSLALLPFWQTIMGFQFENIVLRNRSMIHQALQIKPEEIIADNPFCQNQTKRWPGCQIDYMIQTRYGSLYVCEIKFHQHAVKTSVIAEVQHKIDALAVPKGYSCRPVLIHVNGVSDEVIEKNYFTSIIDVSTFLKKTA